ncbi:MAG: DUF6176 family protein [Vicinamibacterales bacterium]
MQVQCIRIRVLEGRAGEVRTWMKSLHTRADEVLEALAGEGMSDEAVFLLREGDAEFLYIYSRARDLAEAAEAFQASSRPVDVEFKDVIQSCLDVESLTTLDLVFAADLSARFVV